MFGKQRLLAISLGCFAVALTALLVAISRGADWGWDSTKTVALMLVGVNGLGLFGIFQRRTREPLVNMATFVRRPVLTTNIATLLIGSAMSSTFVLVPQLGQLPKGGEIGFGLSATEAGLLLAPGGLASLLVAPLVGRIGERSGSKAPFFAGCLIVAGALLGLALAHDSVGLVVLWSYLVSAGSGAAFAAIPNLIVTAVSDRETGEATGVNTIMRNIGSAVGAQIAGSLIAAHVLASGLPQNAGFEIAFLISAAAPSSRRCRSCSSPAATASPPPQPGRRRQRWSASIRTRSTVSPGRWADDARCADCQSSSSPLPRASRSPTPRSSPLRSLRSSTSSTPRSRASPRSSACMRWCSRWPSPRRRGSRGASAPATSARSGWRRSPPHPSDARSALTSPCCSCSVRCRRSAVLER
jgi:hypothetical protein